MTEMGRWLRHLPTFEPMDWLLSDLLIKGVQTPSSILELSIALLHRATRQGHVCLDLSRLSGRRYSDSMVLGGEEPLNDEGTFASLTVQSLPTLTSWKETLTASGVVGRPVERLPLVLDGDRLYLERYYRHERVLAECLRSRLGKVRREVDPVRAKSILERWFAGAPELAKQAAAIAIARSLCVLAGGPGTGKTSTVVRLLGALTELARDDEGGAPRVLLLAPTGKAASRLSESILHAKTRLSDTLPEVLALSADAMTVHRALLGRERSQSGKLMPFMADLVVVDEASMVDLAIMRRLFEAAELTERVVLLGDPHQLASVEAGAVLGDICEGTKAGYVSACDVAPSIDDVVVELVESHRFKDDGGIGRLASLIRRGDADGVLEVLALGDEAAVFLEVPDVPLDSVLERIWSRYEGLRTANTPEEALVALERFRVLCVHRRGRFGVETWNERLAERVLRFERSRSGRPCARPLLIRENADDGSLYNGDLGVLYTSNFERGARAYFRSAASSVESFAFGRLPAHESAFAMSVHKSQGSEVDEVLVLLPEATSPLLTRELLYTAVTRARQRCVIVGTKEALKCSVRAQVVRQSGLSCALRAPNTTP